MKASTRHRMKPPKIAGYASAICYIVLRARSVVAADDDAASVPCVAEKSAFTLSPAWLSYVVIGFLIFLSALFSG